MRYFMLGFALLLAGCGSAPEKKAAAPPPPAPVKDNRIRLLAENQVSAMLVQNHLLGKQALPGGTLGQYDDHERKYQIFIVETDSAQAAAILMLDAKAFLTDPQYLAHMGGYFGTDAGKPFYVFADKQYLAGVVGLEEDLADPVARQLALRLR
jgi:hypothetical protein